MNGADRQVVEARGNVRLTLCVNGEAHDVLFAPYKTLLEVLREDLDLTGTKHGCELGECGACAVLLDGEPRAVVPRARASNAKAARSRRSKGSAAARRLHPLQAAFADLGAAQCGYCTPGFLLTAKALLDTEPAPEPRADQGGVCRATSAAARATADLRVGRGSGARGCAMQREGAANERAAKRFDVIGKPRRRVDGRAKVTGQTRFADDIVLPRMLHAKLLRSPHPHARIVASTPRARSASGRAPRADRQGLPDHVRHPARVAGRACARAASACATSAIRSPP